MTFKKGAIELSIGTIVILVLAMAMLVLGLVLVKNIFSGATYNINTINDKVKQEIGNLFAEEGKSVVYLADHKADIKQGDNWGVAFAVRNNVVGTSQSAVFSYEIVATDISPDCRGLTKEIAQSWIKSRRTDSSSLAPGETGYFLSRLVIPEDAPLCVVPYNIIVKKDGQTYTQDFFDINVK